MVGRWWFVTVLALVGLGVPPMLHAQQPAPTSGAPVDPEMRELATIQLELDATRDEYFAMLAAVHEEAPKDALREDFSKAVEAVCQKHGITIEQFEQEIFLVSSDDAALEAFDEALKVLTDDAAR